MPMNPKLLRPRASGVHLEAAAWRTAVVANGGTVSGSTLSAVDKFCKAIDSAGIRDRIYRLNLICGTGLNAALVPLYRGLSRAGTQFGNTTDTNNGPFVSGDYEETGASGGLKGNGSTKYLDTGFQQATIPSLNSSHLSASFREMESVAAERTIVGTWGGTSSQFAVLRQEAGTGNRSVYLGSFGNAEAAGATAESHVIGTRTANNLLTLYRAGSSVATFTQMVTPTTTTQSFYVFARNNANSSATTFTGLRLRMYSIGLGLTAAQALAFSNAVASFNTALNRA